MATFWTMWCTSTLVSFVFAVMALITFVQLYRVRNSTGFTGRREIRGPMAAEFFGVVAVVVTNLLAFMVFLRKSASRATSSFWEGYVLATYACTAGWMILVGVVMWAGNDRSLYILTPHWWPHMANTFVATYLFAWFTAGFYLATSGVLICFMRTFARSMSGMDPEPGPHDIGATTTPAVYAKSSRWYEVWHKQPDHGGSDGIASPSFAP